MKKLLNTLYVTSPESYLSLDGENIVVLDRDIEIGRVPLHNLEAVVSFGLPRSKPCFNGRMCRQKHCALLFVTTGQIFGTRHRQCERKCVT